MRRIFILLLFSLLIVGCLQTHRFQTGKLLKQGESRYTFGYSHVIDLSEQVNIDPVTKITAFSVDYRFGVWDKWKYLEGIEMGYRLEGSSVLGTNIGFDVYVKLPSTGFHHSMGGGWVIGTFLDNTYFLEYAISKEILDNDLIFFNTSGHFLATHINDVLKTDNVDPFNRKFLDNRFSFRSFKDRFVFQSSIGFSSFIPDYFFLCPSVLIPQINFIFPAIKNITISSYWNVALGISWSL